MGLTNDLDNVAQLVWIKVWRFLPTLDEPERFTAWTISIARNSAIDYWRSQKENVSLDSIDPGVSNVSLPPAGSDLIDLSTLMEGLSRDHREALILYSEGWSHKEIAELLSISLLSSIMRRRRARAAVKRRGQRLAARAVRQRSKNFELGIPRFLRSDAERSVAPNLMSPYSKVASTKK